ncbi:MAG: FIG00995371: possibly secreted protein [uncultured Blastococcus sp.]|uniref:FIG00995371: possibly secreted protein n=1 Tax=uncultured Blastococcus sp. TaxID=217144 RepID=A0A6J4IN89_9ACTN|nr:MAG: FIG00995371: possibly secreted protein [uncultured Blastococcus sp.]
MNTPLTLAGFGIGLVAVFGAAAGIGTWTGPVGPAAAEQPAEAAHDMGADEHEPAPAAELPAKGLLVSQDGYTLALDRAALPAGPASPVSFRILGPDGTPVTAYDESHDEDLHLIAVRRDLSGFQHVHPALGADGTWTTPLTLTPGTWRLFADFVPAADGENRTLGADLAVAGNHRPVPLPAPSRTTEVDGYTVTLDGDLVAGAESQLTLSVSRDGRPVTDLQPYLAAYGHLVVLREGDLGYLHVHPTGEPGDGVTQPGPDIAFSATTPSPGTYRLFLDFRHGNAVRTAEFTVEAGA